MRKQREIKEAQEMAAVAEFPKDAGGKFERLQSSLLSILRENFSGYGHGLSLEWDACEQEWRVTIEQTIGLNTEAGYVCLSSSWDFYFGPAADIAKQIEAINKKYDALEVITYRAMEARDK